MSLQNSFKSGMSALLCAVFLYSPVALSENASGFSAGPIPDKVWSLMQGKTYKENPYIKREDLRYLKVRHVDFNGKVKDGEIVCNKKIADDLLEIFEKLYAAHYPIERIVLPDYYDADDERQMQDNNTSSFCYREVAGTKVLSAHAKGMAVDLNTFYNPYCKIKKDGTLLVQPKTAKDFCERSHEFSHKIDELDLAYRLFTERGFTWGGSWKSLKDYQHFEKAD